MLRNSPINTSLRPPRQSGLTARLRAASARRSAKPSGIPVVLIPGGPSRGIWMLRAHLPLHPIKREGAILRLLGAQGSHVSDGIGGDRPTIRFNGACGNIAARRPGTPPTLCLIAPAAGRGGLVRARILYPDGRWSHRGSAVTGVVTLAVGCCPEGNVLAPCRGAHHINIEHPGGTRVARWTPGDGDLPASVARRRDVRLWLRGAAF